MKKIFTILACAMLLATFACKKEKNSPIECQGDCVFTMNDAEGTVVRLACFERFGIKTAHPNPIDTASLFIIGIPDEMDNSFKVEGKSVHFSAAFRENTLTPQFPDPTIDPTTVYQISLVEISQ